MQPDPKDSLLVRFEDGPLHGKGNISNLAGGRDMVISQRVYGWPLPQRLAVLTHPGVEVVAMWDAEKPGESDLPAEIIHSPNAIVYSKVSESQINDDAAAKMTHVIRGAVYRLEDV